MVFIIDILKYFDSLTLFYNVTLLNTTNLLNSLFLHNRNNNYLILILYTINYLPLDHLGAPWFIDISEY